MSYIISDFRLVIIYRSLYMIVGLIS